MKPSERIELIRKFNTSMNTINFVNDLFTQGDSRYLEMCDDVMVAGFLDNKAIIISEKNLPNGLEDVSLSEKGFELIRKPQKDEKILAIKLLKRFGFKIIGTERWFKGGKADVLAVHKRLGKTVAVECGPCRISKAIHYLEAPNAELWLIPVDCAETRKYTVISRGSNWDNYFKFHQNFWMKEMKIAVDRVFKLEEVKK